MRTKLSKIITLEYGKGLKQSARKQGPYPVIGSSGIIGWHKEALVKGPGIVVGRKGSIGQITYVREDFWPIDTAYFIKPMIDLDLRWLSYLLEKINLKKLGLSDVVPGLKRELVYNQNIVLPEPADQKVIAEILSTVDAAFQKVDEAIRKTERIKKGVMDKLLMEGFGHTEFKETKIGRIPKDWDVIRIGELGEVSTGKTPSTSKKKLWNGKIPFVTPGDLTSDKYVSHTERFVTDEGAKSSTLLPENSLMVVCIGSTIGKMALNYRTLITNQQINSVVLDQSKFHPDYVYYSFSKMSNRFKSIAGTAAVPIINKTLFEKFRIPVPKSLDEQKEIVQSLSELDQRILLCKQRKEQLYRIKLGLMNDLLTGKKRVQITAHN